MRAPAVLLGAIALAVGAQPSAVVSIATSALHPPDASGAQPSAVVSIATNAPLHPPFAPDWLGLNVDTASVHNHIDTSDANLRNLLRQLSQAANTSTPLALRIGGTSSNAAIYSPDGSGSASTIFSDATLAALHDFAVACGAAINPFGLRYQTDATGHWNASINATALWARVAAAGLTSYTAWSMGNELFGDVNASIYTGDYVAFMADVKEHAPGWAQGVYGPSAAGFPGNDIIEPFAATNGGGLTASGGGLSFHAYAFKTCSLDLYMDKAAVERMDYYFTSYVAARDASAPGTPLYLEEFATAADGGCDGLSNR